MQEEHRWGGDHDAVALVASGQGIEDVARMRSVEMPSRGTWKLRLDWRETESAE